MYRLKSKLEIEDVRTDEFLSSTSVTEVTPVSLVLFLQDGLPVLNTFGIIKKF